MERSDDSKATDGCTAHYCIVIKPDSRAVALNRTSSGYRLPLVHLPDPCWLPSEVEALNAELMETFGLNCTTLRWLKRAETHNLVLMEWHPGSSSPEIGIEWLDPRGNPRILPAAELQMLRDWQESPADGLAPWEQPGWMRHVAVTLIRIFDGVHHPRVVSFSQFKAAWGMSTLLLVETTEGNYFFKAGAREGVDEYAVTSFLHQKFPAYVREPFMVDERLGWMISREIENTGITRDDHDTAEAIFRAYARIQLGCDDFLRSASAADLRVRDVNWLMRHIERLCSEEDCPAEFRSARSLLPARQLDLLRDAWRRQADELAASRLPLTLSQEDFHFANVLKTGAGPVFIDWADCAKAHAFFSVQRSFHQWRVKDAETARVGTARCGKVYLDEFSHLADRAALQNEFELTAQLSPLYQAFRWQERSQKTGPQSPWGANCYTRAAQNMALAMGLPDGALQIRGQSQVPE